VWLIFDQAVIILLALIYKTCINIKYNDLSLSLMNRIHGFTNLASKMFHLCNTVHLTATIHMYGIYIVAVARDNLRYLISVNSNSVSVGNIFCSFLRVQIIYKTDMLGSLKAPNNRFN
jgi:hypothetical protein